MSYLEALECAKNGKVVYGETLYDVEGNACGLNFFTSSDLFDEIKDSEEFRNYIENSDEYREYENSHTEDEIEYFYYLEAVRQVDLLGLDIDEIIQNCIEVDEDFYSFDKYSLDELQEMCNETEGEYDLITRIVDFCSFAEQNGYNRNETLKDYVEDVIDAIDGLEVGEEYIVRKVNTSQCARHSILKYIYEEILEHKSYLNKIIGTKGMEWECYTDDLDEYEQTMFEKQNLIICRTK